MELVARIIEGCGVVVIVIGAILATGWFIIQLRSKGWYESYRSYRHALGRAILLGLEFLVAGDIIRTVIVEPSLPNVGVLGLIVLIRTFLSIAIEYEVEGRLPWRAESAPPQPGR